ncbi:MAG: Gfo/Idh/MocA family oxidoreductase [Candidatus Hydrogenedentes bacterium]|nr:Gfo/Idh/MocA family oxidoreductase [Candidatus Hydrogenedentota bacterium]
MSEVSRRDFVRNTAMGATAGLAMLGTSKTSWAGANDRIRVAQIGIRGRGRDHLKGMLPQKGVEVTTLCDIDQKLFAGITKEFFEKRKLPTPKAVTDMREVFADPDIDAVMIATPNHWHSLAAIWALQAGKHVYVEKPCSHNYFEGSKLVEAAEKYGKVVQHGSQIRSNPSMQEAIKLLNDGVIGEVYMARGLCYRWRDDIGKKADAPVPEGVNYNLWLGPAPERAFNPNRFHYNWHYMWDYGNGDIGNQGVHQMDVARWGLGVELPTRVTSMGNMYIFDDDKEVPNVITTAFDFPDAGKKGKMLVFDTRPWCTNDEKNAKVGVIFYGSDGYMVIDSYSHYKVYLGQKEQPGPENDKEADHYENFVAAIRANDPKMVNAPIREGHLSSALCHLGLISAKLDRSLTFDPAKADFVGDAEASALLTRQYREPFVVPETV